jgi:hypothetical protein
MPANEFQSPVKRETGHSATSLANSFRRKRVGSVSVGGYFDERRDVVFRVD